MKPKFNCRCCGHCCLNLVDAYQGCVSDADLQRWRQHGRDDLLAWVVTLDLGPGNQLHTAWVDPETGDDVERCPWLLDKITGSGHLCGIDPIKPDHCRNYPEHRRHAVATGCGGYDQPAVLPTKHPAKPPATKNDVRRLTTPRRPLPATKPARPDRGRVPP